MVVRQGHLIAVVVTFLIAVLVFGCGAGGTGNNDGRGGKRGAAATKEETTAPSGDRSKTQTAQEPVGLDTKVVSPLGQANLPAGFGEGSLWATALRAQRLLRRRAGSWRLHQCLRERLCLWFFGGRLWPLGAPKAVLQRLDPQTGEEVAKIPLKDLNDAFLRR